MGGPGVSCLEGLQTDCKTTPPPLPPPPPPAHLQDFHRPSLHQLPAALLRVLRENPERFGGHACLGAAGGAAQGCEQARGHTLLAVEERNSRGEGVVEGAGEEIE
jgi:hypothetical protein